MILATALPPGFRALEQELALRLGVSRTPVREALIRLEAEGLVEVVPRRGMRVLPVSPDDMAEIYAILTSLESEAAGLAADRPAPARALARLERANADMEAAVARGDRDAWAEADARYHRALLDAGGNRRLADTVLTFWDQAHRVRLMTLHLRPPPEASTREHRAVTDAIRAGDAAAARALHRAHRERGGRELVAILRRHALDRV